MRHSLAFILTALSFNFPGIAVASADLPPQAGKPQLGTFGIDTKAMDPAVKPGDDFNRHANGSWLKGDHIPADRPRFGSFDILAKQAEERTRAILEEAASAKSAPGSVHRKIGDFYASFMNEAHVESLGKAPIEPELKRIGAIQSRDDVQSYLIHAANAGMQLPIGATIWPDQKNADQYAVMIYQSGLGMPDRDYYLSDEPRLALARAKYLDFIAKLFALAGIEGGEAKAKGVFEFEKSIAEKHWTRAESRDASKTYNPRTVSELETMAPQIAWARFMAGTRLDVRPVYVVRQTTAVAATAKLLAEAPIATLRDYFAFHAIADAAPYLGKAFVDARFDFVGRTLQGTPELAPRWRRAVIATNAAMNEGIGQVWVQRHFPPESKARMERLVANLKLAMGKRIDGLEWMSEDTKKQAHAKLGTFVTKIGYPDKWRDYSKLEVREDDLFGNVRRGRVFELDRNRDRLGKPTDRKEWYMGPQEVNAYYNAVFNEIVFPAAILQPPFFDPAADDAVNYGAIGAVIGHEIGHGFDDQGRKYDAKGALRDWWTAEDDRRFRERSDRLVDQYSAYCPLPPTGCINGRLALGENVGDLGGLQMAYEAYRLSLGGKETPVIGGYTGDQRFFLAFGQIWRTQMREPYLRNQLTVGPHSPDGYRINGVVRNVDAWYAAFGVKPGDKLYLSPEERVRIW